MPEIPDLWPDLADIGEVVTPLSILKSQAVSLGRKTRNLLEGETRSKTNAWGKFEHRFFLYAPTLDYRLELLSVTHDLNFYPAECIAWDEGPPTEVDNQEEFLRWIRSIFSSPRTTKTITSLLAQSRFE